MWLGNNSVTKCGLGTFLGIVFIFSDGLIFGDFVDFVMAEMLLTKCNILRLPIVESDFVLKM